jgi:hypothetical protein
MPPSSVTPKVRQSLYVHGYFPSTITFDYILVFKYLSDPVDVITVEIVTIHGERKIYFFKYFSSRGQPNTVYVS